MTLPIVGIVGATGTVGTALAEQLHASGRVRPVLGGRDRGKLDVLARRLGAQTQLVEVESARSLAEFCGACPIVVNCAGPWSSVGERVALASLATGSHYVDVSAQAFQFVAVQREDLATRGLRFIAAAGSVPGLSGLLPRYVAESAPGRLGSLRVFLGGFERFSPAAAADFLGGMGPDHGAPFAALRDGRVVQRTLDRIDGLDLPYLGQGIAYPYLSRELVAVALRLGIRRLEAFHVFPGHHTVAALSTLGHARPSETTSPAAIRALIEAADLDMAGKRPVQLLLLDGESTDVRGETRQLRLFVKADDGYALTATMAQCAVDAILAGGVPEGLHDAATVLNVDDVIARLDRIATISLAHVQPGASFVEEGTV